MFMNENKQVSRVITFLSKKKKEKHLMVRTKSHFSVVAYYQGTVPPFSHPLPQKESDNSIVNRMSAHEIYNTPSFTSLPSVTNLSDKQIHLIQRYDQNNNTSE